MIYRAQPFYRFKLVFVFLMVRLRFLRIFLSKRHRNELPTGWNNHMFWVAFKSAGKKFFYDYYCKLKKPISFKPKAAVEDQYKLTEEEIEAFYKKGYIKPFRIMSTEEAEKMREHLVHLVTKTDSKIHNINNVTFETSSRMNDTKENSEFIKEFAKKRLNTSNRHLEDRALFDLLTHPAVVERCAQLLGPNLLLWRSYFFPVEPKSKGTDWHQGSTYMLADWKESVVHPPDHEEIFQLTIWVALTDTHKKRACLATVSDSQWKIHPTIFSTKSAASSVAFGEYDAKIDYDVRPEDVNYIEMKAGECVIFSERAIHGSADNETDDWRWAVNARVVKTDTRVYTDRMRKEGTGIKVFNVKGVNLDNWKAVLMRGEDHYGYNPIFKEEKMEMESELEPQS